MKKSIVYILLSLLLIFVTSCTSIPSYEITFDSNGGTEVEKQVVFEGGHGVKPLHPTKEGYIFAYWSLDGEEYDFTTMIVSNITLVAVWETLDEHTHRYTSTTVKPTCVEKGYDEYICSCGDTYKENYVDELGHTLKEHPAKEPTTSESGWEKYYTCTNCDYTTFKELPTLDSDEIKIYAIDGFRYFNFGKYPQSKVTDESLIAILNTIAEVNANGYIEYENEEYLFALNKSTGKYNWFKVEPIVWKILVDNNDGTYRVITKDILDCGYYVKTDNGYYTPTIEQTKSKINSIAFTSEQMQKIVTQLYIPSKDDVMNYSYGFVDSYSISETRVAKSTEYAYAMGCNNKWDITGTYRDGVGILNQYYVDSDGSLDLGQETTSLLLGYRPICVIKIK